MSSDIQSDEKSWIACEDRLAEALFRLSHEIRESRRAANAQLAWFQSHMESATKHELEQLGKKLMGAIEDFADKVEADFKVIGDKVDGLVLTVEKFSGSIGNIDSDVRGLKKQIEDFLNSTGDLTPEQKARLLKIQETTTGLAAKVESASTVALAAAVQADALDKQTETAPAPVEG